ncbi:hypothetical protein PUN28_010243 [Cardiocondyla obscurior]|uniref:Uncharacterized protein n=1 Tax=Cardiocondyla obscurior TaxID=286306 RepID=A0AAW2FMS2_9HYME
MKKGRERETEREREAKTAGDDPDAIATDIDVIAFRCQACGRRPFLRASPIDCIDNPRSLLYRRAPRDSRQSDVSTCTNARASTIAAPQACRRKGRNRLNQHGNFLNPRNYPGRTCLIPLTSKSKLEISRSGEFPSISACKR